jgi:cell division septal protein FtsQ
MKTATHALDSDRLHSLLVKALVCLLVGILSTGAVLYLLDRERVPELVSRIEWLHVKQVTVTGEWPTEPQVVREWLPKLEGKSLLLVSAEKIISSLGERPWVKEVTIKKDFPNHLRVHVVPKVAVAVLVDKARPAFLDGNGDVIERVTAPMLQKLNLPVISREENANGWAMPAVLGLLEKFAAKMSQKYKVSQLVLGAFPYFKIFLSSPQIEVAFSAETWEDQLPHLALLLDSPPNQIGQIHRINLYYPKKAVVRSTLSN